MRILRELKIFSLILMDIKRFTGIFVVLMDYQRFSGISGDCSREFILWDFKGF